MNTLKVDAVISDCKIELTPEFKSYLEKRYSKLSACYQTYAKIFRDFGGTTHTLVGESRFGEAEIKTSLKKVNGVKVINGAVWVNDKLGLAQLVSCEKGCITASPLFEAPTETHALQNEVHYFLKKWEFQKNEYLGNI